MRRAPGALPSAAGPGLCLSLPETRSAWDGPPIACEKRRHSAGPSILGPGRERWRATVSPSRHTPAHAAAGRKAGSSGARRLGGASFVVMVQAADMWDLDDRAAGGRVRLPRQGQPAIEAAEARTRTVASRATSSGVMLGRTVSAWSRNYNGDNTYEVFGRDRGARWRSRLSRRLVPLAVIVLDSLLGRARQNPTRSADSVGLGRFRAPYGVAPSTTWYAELATWA